jgi:parallel beta-helix repeat protein
MKTIKQLKLAAAVAAGLALVGCGSDDDSSDIARSFDCTPVETAPRTICIGSESDLSDEKVFNDINAALDALELTSGDTIVLPEGRYKMSAGFSINGLDALTDITIKGAGIDKTILDFDGTAEDSFLIENMDNLIMEDMGVYESANNAVKTQGVDGVILRRIATVWETDYSPQNGAYGLYPVLSENVLIEDCYVQGSADAGVYVGQTINAIVRGCEATKNVAGIEIENTINADVYNNHAHGNTGGILVFNLPIDNNTRYTANVRVFDNVVESNNAPNFAEPGSNPAGVHIVPPGTGVILLAAQDVEVFNNNIVDNETIAIAVTSFLLPDDDVENYATSYGSILVSGWVPLMKSVNIHDNTISQARYAPKAGNLEPMQDVVLGYAFQTQAPIPDIFYDGVGELLANAQELEDFQALEALDQADTFDPAQFTYYNYANNGADKSDAICVSDNGDATVGAISLNGYDLLVAGATLQAAAEGGADAGTLAQLQANLDAEIAAAFELDESDNPTTYKAILQADEPAMFACGGETGREVPTASSGTTVTFGESSFACGVDDAATAPDTCIAI